MEGGGVGGGKGEGDAQAEGVVLAADGVVDVDVEVVHEAQPHSMDHPAHPQAVEHTQPQSAEHRV